MKLVKWIALIACSNATESQGNIDFYLPTNMFDLLPLIILFILLPLILIYILFKKLNFRLINKLLLTPICIVGPLILTILWPFFIRHSGFLGSTGGGDGKVPYGVIAVKIFGEYSEYVWVSLTSVVVFIIYRISNKSDKKA